MSKFDDIYKGIGKLVKDSGPEITKKFLDVASKYPCGTKGIIGTVLGILLGSNVLSYNCGKSNEKKKLVKSDERFLYEVELFENDDLTKEILINEIEHIRKINSGYEIYFYGKENNSKNDKLYSFNIDYSGNQKIIIRNIKNGNEICMDVDGVDEYIKIYNSKENKFILCSKMEI